MTEILLINPGSKKRPGRTKGANMKRKSTLRRNPSAKKMVKRGSRRLFGGINPKLAVSNAVVGQGGMLMAQFFAKKFGGGGKSFFDIGWTWENYAWATAGSFVAGLAGNMLMPGKGNKMVEHGLGLTLNKFLQDAVIQKNPSLKSALGNYDRLSARYANPQSLRTRLNPNASLRGNYQRQASPLRGRIEAEGPLGGDMTASNYLGNKPFEHAFIR
jgi:hypothetical protein